MKQLALSFFHPLFTNTSLSLVGWHPDAFSFQNAPLSTRPDVVKCFVLYLTVVLGGQAFMRKFVKEPVSVKPLFFLHNAILSAASLALLVLFLEIIVPNIWNNGLLWSMCSPNAYTPRIEFLYYINYLIKYYEFIDTAFLVLKKKKLEFLHVYHHSMTMALCYFELEGRTSVSWVPVTLNLLVHVIMYYYYARTAVSSKPIWWKKHLTTLQIAQFIIDLFAIYTATYIYLSSGPLAGTLPNFELGYCAGTPLAAGVGCFILTSYLGLFIQFFIKTYKDKRSAKGGKMGKTLADASQKMSRDMGEEKVASAVRKEGTARRRLRRAD